MIRIESDRPWQRRVLLAVETTLRPLRLLADGPPALHGCLVRAHALELWPRFLQSEDASREGTPEPDLGLGIAKRRDDRGPDAGQHGLVLQEMTQGLRRVGAHKRALVRVREPPCEDLGDVALAAEAERVG